MAALSLEPEAIAFDEASTLAVATLQESNSVIVLDLALRGGRMLSGFRLSDGALLSDTGNALDAAANETGRWGAFVEAGNRARRGGSEPEGVHLVETGGRTLAVVGLERGNALVLVDVTDPSAPSVLDQAGIGGLGSGARKGPEGIDSITVGGRTFVLAGFEVSGVVGVFEIR